MPAQTSSARITFADGLLESQESSKVPIGFLTECVNWVPEPGGGLRVRAKWFKGSENGITATRRCMGIGMFQRYVAPAIVQRTEVVQGTLSGATSATPIFSWRTPTAAGNTIILVAHGVSNASASAAVSGYTTRLAFAPNAGTAATKGSLGVYELVTTASQQGDVTPLVISQTGGGTVSYYSAYLVEIQGLGASAFDKTSSSTKTSPGTSVTPSTAATTQASELVLAFDGARQDSSTTAFTLSTATVDWSELTEAGQATGTDYQQLAIYYGTRTATATQTLTVDSSASVYHEALLLTYKGWYAPTSPPTVVENWLAANADTGNTYDILRVPRSTNTEALNGAYVTFDTNLGSTLANEPVAFTMGLGACWYTAASFSGVRKYDGVTASAVAGSPLGARCIAVHKGRLWAGSGTRVNFTQVNDGNTWVAPQNRGTGYFDVGKDDGEVIEDITPFAGMLVIGKRTSIHIITGNNTDTFSEPEPLSAGGAASGRSLLATPYGCVIAGREQVWLFDGQNVTPIGRAIESSYGIADGGFVSLSYIDGSIYIATGSKVFVFDLNAGVWRIEQVGDGTNESPAVVYNYGETQLMGPVAGTEGSLINYRSFPAPTRGKDFDDLAMTFSAQTGDLALAGSRRPTSPRQLYLQLRQRGGDDTQTGLMVTPIFNGVSGDACDVSPDSPGVRRDVVSGFPQKTGVDTFAVRFSQTLPAGQSSTFDIEDCFADVIVEEARS